MKCHDVDFLLDDREPHELARQEREAIDAHLAACDECRSAWEAYGAVATLERPRIPAALMRRIAESTARSSRARRRGRSVLIGTSMALAGAAVAAVWTLAPGWFAADEASSGNAPANEAAPMSAAAVGGPRAEDNASPAGPVLADREVMAVPSPPADSVSRPVLKVAVLPVVDGDADRSLIPMFGVFYAELGAGLAALGWDVVSPEHVAPYADAGLPEEEIARHLGADRIVVAVLQQGPMAISVYEIDAASGASLGMGTSGQLTRANDDAWLAAAEDSVAWIERTRDRPSPVERAVQIAAAEAKVLDRSLSFAERADALAMIGPSRVSDALVAAAVEIATSAEDASIRNRVWSGMKGVGNRYLVQPLVAALAGDPDYNVRRAAAFTLADYVDEPGVREALERAAAEDAEETVRRFAQWAATSNDEMYRRAIETLYDESAPASERLRAVGPADNGMFGALIGGGVPIGMALDEDAQREIVEIATGTDDADVRLRGWMVLQRHATDPSFVEPLLDDALGHPRADVRQAAVVVLARFGEDPQVRTALERVRNEDAAWQVRRSAREALGEVAQLGQ